MKYKVKYKTGWRGIGYDSEVETIVVARDFDEAVHTANRRKWNSDVCAKIVAIEEIEEKEP
jgi:hypothetical protein